MGFAERRDKSDVLMSILKTALWDEAVIHQRLVHVQYGAERIVPPEVHRLIRFTRTETTRRIKFAPDFFVVDKQDPERTYLLEYKCMQTPLYSPNRIRMIKTQSPRKEIDWPDIGQWEAEAYDNYRALGTLGIRVVILNYCAYHDRLVVCDFIEKVSLLHRDHVQLETMVGSRTPYINFDLTAMRSLEEFLIEEHGFDSQQVNPLCMKVKDELRNKLPITHNLKSPHYGRKT